MLLKRMTSLRMTGRVHAHAPSRRAVVPPRILSSPLRFRRLQFRVAAKVERAEVLGKVITIIGNQLGKDTGSFTEETKFEELGADSLDVVEIMMAFEEEFGITLNEEGAEKIKTVSEAAELIKQEIEK